MKSLIIRSYKGYNLEITSVGIDLAECWRPYKYYALYKVSLREAISYIRKNPAPDLESLGWEALVFLDNQSRIT